MVSVIYLLLISVLGLVSAILFPLKGLNDIYALFREEENDIIGSIKETQKLKDELRKQVKFDKNTRSNAGLLLLDY